MAERITDKLVKELTPPPSGNRIIYDERVKGFGVRITAGGAKAFVLNYRNAEGIERRLTIGTYGPNEWSVEAARKRAGDLKKTIAGGGDPLAVKVATRTAPTVSDLCARYIEDHLPRKSPSSQAEDKSMIKKIIKPKLGNRKVAAVNHSDIDKLHRSLLKTPYRANRVLALVSKMFSLSIRWGWRPDNPAVGVERNPEHPRERYLSPKELTRLSKSLASHPEQQSANAIRLLLLTGARRSEVLSMSWDQLDLDSGVWTKPSAHTKQNKEHRVPLSAPALQLLVGMMAAATPKGDTEPDSHYVFPGRKAGEPMTDIKKFWSAVRKTAEIEDCRVHDLRHTYASMLASAGHSLPIIGALLGHTQPGTTARYAHLFDDPLRKATDTVGAILSGKKPGKVVQMRKDGAA